jgi:hypothetical protein
VALPSPGVLLLEFAAQGVRGVAPAGGRATLRPGYNVVAADGAALRRLLEALLHPDPRDGDGLPRAPGGPGAGPVRAGLTLVGDDRVTYRVVRDFAAGCQLHRFDAEKRAFVPVAQEFEQIATFLRETVGVPTLARQAALLTFGAAELPSKAGGAVLSSGGGAAAAVVARPSLSPDQARKRLAELERELERAAVAEKLQYQLDGLQSKLFKTEEALKSGQRIQEGLTAAETERASLDRVVEVAAGLGDPSARLAAHEKATARRDEALARVASEREALEAAEARGRPQPLWELPGFLAGVGGGLLFLVLGVVGAASGSELRTAALLSMPGFGWAGWEAHRWIGELDAWSRQARRRKVVDDWERKILEQFERDTAEIGAILKALQLSKPGELRDLLDRVEEADRAVAERRSQLDAWDTAPDTAGAVAERARVEEELRSVEARLSGEAGGFVRDVQSVEAELERLKADMAAPPAVSPAPAALAAPAAPARATPAAVGEPLRGLLERAAAELGGSPASVARALGPKASQLLAGLSLNRFSGVSADDRGNVQVVSGGRPSPALTLPPADKDLVFAALKLALLEQAVTGGKTVALVEDAFGGMSDGARRTIGRYLKQAAKSGQVLHATSDPACREAADHQA